MERRPLAAIGRQRGAVVVGYYFEPRLDVSLRRNALRTGRELVPVVGILAVHARLTVPSAEEGFDEVWAVWSGEGRFTVTPLTQTDPADCD